MALAMVPPGRRRCGPKHGDARSRTKPIYLVDPAARAGAFDFVSRDAANPFTEQTEAATAKCLRNRLR
jgi:hypothetical protein